MMTRRTLLAVSVLAFFTAAAAAQSRVDVTAFGATGDGVHDDTAAIQAAINSVDENQGHLGGEVYLPKGTYLVSKPLILGNLVSIFGDGWASIIKMANHANINLLQQPATGSVTYITIRDLNLFGNDYNNTAGSAISISYNGSAHSDIHVEDVLINHFGGDCVYIATGWHYHFNSNIIEACGGSIMHFQPVVGPSDGVHDLRRVFIESNGLMWNTRPNNHHKDGIYFQGGSGETLTGINIVGNQIGNNDIALNAVHLQSVSNFVISGNRIGGGSQYGANTYDGVRIDDDGVLASQLGVISGNSFANGDALGGQERYGISISSLTHGITIGANQFSGILTQNIFVFSGARAISLIMYSTIG